MKILLSVKTKRILRLSKPMKRQLSPKEDSVISKMARLEIESEVDNSIVVASGKDMSIALARHFNYELSDKKAKSNLLKCAAREAFEIVERTKCTMLTFSLGSYLEMVMPTVVNWKNSEQNIQVQDLEI